MPPTENEARRPLKIFAYTIGGIQFVLYIAMIIYSSILVKNTDTKGPATEPCTEKDDEADNTTSTTVAIAETTTESTTVNETTTSNEFLPGVEHYPLIFPIVYLVLSIICLITVILLLYGLAKNAPEYLLPWILFHIVAVFVFLSIGVFRLTRKGPVKEITHNDVDCVLYLFYAGIHFVVIWFVFMLYRIMSEDYRE